MAVNRFKEYLESLKLSVKSIENYVGGYQFLEKISYDNALTPLCDWLPDNCKHKAKEIEKLPEYIKRNKSGNNMYSATLNHFSGYVMERVCGIHSGLSSAGLRYDESFVNRFVLSLLTKPFLILTGLSGSGKTKLAEAFAMWASECDEQCCIVPVGADWTTREPLLGYPNALDNKKYVMPDSGVLNLLIKASQDPLRPYFLILDEMNMSHVERYFADFLSAMESVDGKISLHPKTDGWEDDTPSELRLPQNLFIIGTVNIDETTYMFSPKVLDRANVMEFMVSERDIESFLESPSSLDFSKLKHKGAGGAKNFLEKATNNVGPVKSLGQDLMPFFNELKKLGAEFGYRTAYEINRFVRLSIEDQTMGLDYEKAVDSAIVQKLLPKIHGSRNKIIKLLEELGKLCLRDNAADSPFELNNVADAKYELSYDKLRRMHSRVMADGFASFAEA